MFTSFSWTNYFLLTGFLVLGYAIVILVFYYRIEMRNLFFGKPDALNEMIERPVAAIAEPMQLVHELVSELGVVIRKAAEDRIVENELFFGLQQVVRNYLILRDTEFKSRINLFIKDEMEICGLAPIAEEQFALLWRD
ncbi:hypothetical protein GWC95_15375 [Sediminibacterium roseum]|uniref:LemA protein n=1 Tax=Sediminibacterium roseum TaxID=1978412 RepID=A0ABX0A1N9_9BACT|nr:hypothetical protein [Sediminibacterium roseum]NCI51308.1 hypothetical protein [Sediminibacterium roseum]